MYFSAVHNFVSVSRQVAGPGAVRREVDVGLYCILLLLSILLTIGRYTISSLFRGFGFKSTTYYRVLYQTYRASPASPGGREVAVGVALSVCATDFHSNAGFWSNESRRTSHGGLLTMARETEYRRQKELALFTG